MLTPLGDKARDPDDVIGCPNRVFQVMKVKGDEIEWGEQRLRREKDGTVDYCKDWQGEPVKAKWQSGPTRFYTALGRGEPVPSWEMLGQQEFRDHNQDDGFILRRIDIDSTACSSTNGEQFHPFDFQEFFVPNIKEHEQSAWTAALRFLGLAPPPSCEPGDGEQFVYERDVPATCYQPAGTALEVCGFFSNGYSYRMACLARDH